MKKSFVVLMVGSLLLTTAAYADTPNSRAKISARSFYNLIETYRKSCAPECQVPFSHKTIFDINEPDKNELSPVLRSRLQKVAFDQAQIWGDTILEGDYYSDGQTQLDSVAALYKEDRLIGYKIRYSEKAWDTEDCDFDEFDESTLNACSAGRIQESGFISPDFKNFFRDEDHFANFLK